MVIGSEAKFFDPKVALSGNTRRLPREDLYGPVVLGICHHAIAEIFMSRMRGTVQATLEFATHLVHAEQIRLDAEHEENPVMFHKRCFLKPPTRGLIQRLIDEIPAFERYAARYGQRAATVKFRFQQDEVLSAPPALDAITVRSCMYDRMLNHKGIEFANIRYNSASFQDLRYREGADLWVKIAVDEENLGRIWLILKSGKILEGKALEKYNAEGLSLQRHKKLLGHRRSNEYPDKSALLRPHSYIT